MEEARQHPALTADQRVFAWIYHLGSLVLIAAICLQIIRRIDALYPAILGVGASRIGLAAWQLAEPECSKTPRTRSGLLFTIATWVGAILLLIWARRYGSGA